MNNKEMTPEAKLCVHNWKQRPQTADGYKMDKFCPRCNSVVKDIYPATTFEGFARRWVHGKLTVGEGKKQRTQTKCGKYVDKGDKLIYFGSGRNTPEGEDVLAIKLPNGVIVGNASQLPRCGSFRRGTEAPVQQVMQKMAMALLPFNIFDEAELDITQAEIIEQGKAENLLLPKLYWNEQESMFLPLNIWKRMETKKVSRNKDGSISPKAKKELEALKPKAGKWVRKIEAAQDWGDPRKDYWRYTTLDRTKLELRHFIGAMLFKVGDKHFLFDADRRELEWYNFNPFLSELPEPVGTIEEAYDLLKPEEVKQAERRGKKVLRQGEWFFIPEELPKSKVTKAVKDLADSKPSPGSYDLAYIGRHISDWDNDVKDLLILDSEVTDYIREYKIKKMYWDELKSRVKDYNEAVKKWDEARLKARLANPEKFATDGELRAGDNRPNNVTKLVELPDGKFVKGTVTHSGREHEPLELNQWCKPVPNTAVASFTIEGNID